MRSVSPVALGSVLAAAGTVHAALNRRALRRPVAVPSEVAAELGRRVSVLVPARNEAARIAGCLTALSDQDCAEILVLDDGSTDATAALVDAAGDPRVRRLTGAELPAGWLGKPHACDQLARAADPLSTVLVFVDADVRLAPGAVAAAVDLLERSGLDLVSPYPRQLAATPTERLVQPLLVWSWLTLLPLRRAEASPRPSLSAANGQFLVVRRAAYQRCGGHRAVRRTGQTTWP